jgi:transposase-like protein
VVKESIDVLGLLRKRGVDGDVDFLREALAVLVQAIMGAEVTEQVGADYGERA